ncbi:MAG: PEP/pyruvate-binding domain-containing protein [Actinomycetales bacterium]
MASFVVEFTESADLAQVGGKGVNLARMTRAGFRVPPGFTITTAGYRDFVAENGLDAVIREALGASDPDPSGPDPSGPDPSDPDPSGPDPSGRDLSDPHQCEQASRAIRAAFGAGTVPAALAREIARATWRLAEGEDARWAVRSSATAEDLPGLSFAGQQDSYLNTPGEAVLARVVDCWSSLWTARAIGYRASHGIPQGAPTPSESADPAGDSLVAAEPDAPELALAVVVQAMVESEVSGVMFTADPVSGIRTHTVVDATAGLGEALVSGQTEPDHLVLQTATGRVLATSVGAKAVLTVSRPGGGVETIERAGNGSPGLGQGSSVAGDGLCLGPDQVAELAALSRQIEAEYGTPQDVEFAFSGGELYVVQSRSITTLFDVPVPFGPHPDPALTSAWVSFAAVQGVSGPITPLGRDAVAHVAAGAGRIVGLSLRPDHVWFVGEAHERLWIRIDGLLRNPIGRRIVPRVLGIAEPGSLDWVRQTLLTDDRFTTGTTNWRGIAVRMAAMAPQVLPRLVLSMGAPGIGRRVFDATAERLVERVQLALAYADAIDDDRARLDAEIRVAREGLGAGLAVMFPAFAPIMVPSLVMLGRLQKLARDSGRLDETVPLQLMRGLAGNVTTDMDLRLWGVAVSITGAGERDELVGRSAADLAADYRAGSLPAHAQREITAFLAEYGMRGVGEIDLGRPRWAERPEVVLGTLLSYLQVQDPHLAPDQVYRRAVADADLAAQQLVDVAGPWRAPLVRLAVRRIRTLMGARETPKFTIISVLGLIRERLLAAGRSLAREGRLDRAEDVGFLTLSELDAAVHGVDHRETVRDRRSRAVREERRVVPRIILGDGHAHYGSGAAAGPNGLSGSGVSPGLAEGRVRVVDDPQHAGLLPGEILVCVGTDPAWTPLFLAAAGLITEVGGMMTHGSVVAREYGIPAVVGVTDATSRLTTGERVRVDGSSGLIERLD